MITCVLLPHSWSQILLYLTIPDSFGKRHGHWWNLLNLKTFVILMQRGHKTVAAGLASCLIAAAVGGQQHWLWISRLMAPAGFTASQTKAIRRLELAWRCSHWWSFVRSHTWRLSVKMKKGPFWLSDTNFYCFSTCRISSSSTSIWPVSPQ